jgi:hypothetical protein
MGSFMPLLLAFCLLPWISSAAVEQETTLDGESVTPMELDELLNMPFDPSQFDVRLLMHASGVFSTLDEDGDGSISWSEFKKVFFKDPLNVGIALGQGYGKVQEIKAHHQKLKKVYDNMDVEATGKVTFKDFQRFIWTQMLAAREIDATYLWRAKERLQLKLHPTPRPTILTRMPTPYPSGNPTEVPTKIPTLALMDMAHDPTSVPTLRPTIPGWRNHNNLEKTFGHAFGKEVKEIRIQVPTVKPTRLPTRLPTTPTGSPTFSEIQQQESDEAQRLVKKSGWTEEMVEDRPPTWMQMQAFYAKYNPDMIPSIDQILKRFSTELIIVSQQKKYGASMNPPAPTRSPTAYPVPTVSVPTYRPTSPTYSPTMPTASPITSLWDWGGASAAGKKEKEAKNHVAPPNKGNKKVNVFYKIDDNPQRGVDSASPTSLPTAHPATASPTAYLPKDKTFGFDWVEGMVPKDVEKSLTPDEKRARLQWKVKRKQEIEAHSEQVYKLSHPPAPTAFPTQGSLLGSVWAPKVPGLFDKPTHKPTAGPTLPTSAPTLGTPQPTPYPTATPTTSPTAKPTQMKNNLQMFANIFGLNVMGFKPTLPPTMPCPASEADDPNWMSDNDPPRTCPQYRKGEKFHAFCAFDLRIADGMTAHDACKSACCRMSLAPTATPTSLPTPHPTRFPTPIPTNHPTKYAERFNSGQFKFHIVGHTTSIEVPTQQPTVKHYSSKFEEMEDKFGDAAGAVGAAADTKSKQPAFDQASAWYKKGGAFHMPAIPPSTQPTKAPTFPPTSKPTPVAFVPADDINHHAGEAEASDVEQYIRAQLAKIEHAQEYVKSDPDAAFADKKELKKLLARKQQLKDVLSSLVQQGK